MMKIIEHRKVLILIMIITVLSSILNPYGIKGQSASSVPQPAISQLQNVTVKVKGKAVDLTKNRALLINGSTYLPALSVLTAMGSSPVYKDGKLTAMTADKKKMEITGAMNIKGVLYLPWSSFRKTMATVDWFPSSKTFVIYPYIYKNVMVYFDWMDETKNKKEYIYTQVPLWDRFLQSGLFEFKNDYRIVLKDKNARIEVTKAREWYTGYETVDIGFYIPESCFGYYPRRKLFELLKVCFPSQYNLTYDYLMKSLRQELWEHGFNSPDPGISSQYIESRKYEVFYHRYNNFSRGCVIDIRGYRVVTSKEPSETGENNYAMWKKQDYDLKEFILKYELDRW